MTENQKSKMENGKWLILGLGVFALLPAVALAAEGAEHGASVMDWVWKIINFAILAAALVYFMARPIKEHLKKRRELIENSIKESQEAKALAIKALAEVEERLKLKDRELADIISSAVEAGEREKARLIEEGEKLKVKITEQARTNIDFEVKKAKETIQAEAVEASLKLAEEKIKARMTPQEQERLLKESIKLMEGKN